MRALILVFALLAASMAGAAAAQDGERQGTAAGATRPTPQYLGRQQLLEAEVEAARRRYEVALKRWNDLKY